MYLDVPLGALYDPCLDSPAIPLSELIDLDRVTPVFLVGVSSEVGGRRVPYPDGVRGRVLMGDVVLFVLLLLLFSWYKAALLLFLLNVPLLLFLLKVVLLLFRLSVPLWLLFL